VGVFERLDHRQEQAPGGVGGACRGRPAAERLAQVSAAQNVSHDVKGAVAAGQPAARPHDARMEQRERLVA
jgi:hypothetical protein